MRPLVTKFLFFAVPAAVLLLVVTVIAIRRPISMAQRLSNYAAQGCRLQFSGYALTSNQVKVAVFLLTNPGPVEVDCWAHTESGSARTVTIITNMILASHSAISFQIAPTNLPTRFQVDCSVHRSLRDLADEAKGLVGLRPGPRGTEYSVWSDELK